MAPIVFGLDLRAIRPAAFKSANMFDKRFLLRKERFIIYQLAMIFTVVGECMATYALDKYLQLQNQVSASQPGASYYNNDIIGVAGLTIFAGVLTATVFGTMFFFLLFWPSLPESVMWSRIKYASSVFCSIVVFAAALSSTIVIAKNSGHLIPSSQGNFEQLQAIYAQPTPPYHYRDYPFCIAWLVLFWIGWIFTILSTYYVFKASRFHLANPHVVQTYPQQPEIAFGSQSEKTPNGQADV